MITSPPFAYISIIHHLEKVTLQLLHLDKDVLFPICLSFIYCQPLCPFCVCLGLLIIIIIGQTNLVITPFGE